MAELLEAVGWLNAAQPVSAKAAHDKKHVVVRNGRKVLVMVLLVDNFIGNSLDSLGVCSWAFADSGMVIDAASGWWC